MTPLRLAGTTALALVGFAANSLLCRLALAVREIDAVTFTSVRLLSGALVLAALARRRTVEHGDVPSALWLVGYALPFSLAYVRIGGGVGALLLFAAVQLTMFGVALLRGERPGARVVLGLVAAFVGVVVLLAPGVSAPDPLGGALMIGAGVAWGAYSLRGRTAKDALGATAGNFARAAPLALLGLGLTAVSGALHASPTGLLLATLSGAVASGLGYALWYAVVPTLGRVRAAVVQLAAPLLAAVGAVPILGERPSLRLAAAAILVCVGVFSAVTAPPPPSPRPG